MNFRLELAVKPFLPQLNIRHKVMLVGSCFTDHISNRLQQHLFDVVENPHGILFNPLSIATAIADYIAEKKYSETDLFFANDLWQSWQHHSSLSHWDKSICLAQINDANERTHQFLKTADWLIITLGSSFVYALNNDSLGGTKNNIAANCHKIPAPHFTHRLAAYAEVETALENIISGAKKFNPNLNIIFTISPVRHSREGLVENNRSKGLLHTAVYAMLQRFDRVQYFPSYELVIDDLRDYRFYAEDLVHPNYQATQYVWEKFCDAVIDAESGAIMKQIHSIQLAVNHRPMHVGSAQHQQFLKTMHSKTTQLQMQFPFLNLTRAIDYFTKAI